MASVASFACSVNANHRDQEYQARDGGQVLSQQPSAILGFDWIKHRKIHLPANS